MKSIRIRRSRAGALLSFLGLASLAALTVASEPPSSAVTVPTTAGQTVTVQWSGTIPAGVTPGVGANCTADQALVTDVHDIALTVPANAYDNVKVVAEFKIEWGDATQDEALGVTRDGQSVGTSDGGDPQEIVILNNQQAGAYQAIGFLSLKKPPVGPSSGSVASHTAVSAISAISATSSGRPMRPSGIMLAITRRMSDPPHDCGCTMAVSIGPGWMAFTSCSARASNRRANGALA